MWELIKDIFYYPLVVFLVAMVIINYLVLYVTFINTLERLDTENSEEPLPVNNDTINKMTALSMMIITFIAHAAFFGWIYTGDFQ